MTNTIYYRAVLLGGLVSAATDAFPVLNLINCLCCLGIAAGGAVSILYLRRFDNGHVFTTPEVINIGLMTGLSGAFAAFLLHYLTYRIYGNWQVEWLTNMMNNMEELPPLWAEFYDELQSPEYQGFAGRSILIRSLLIFPVFCFIGAQLTVRILQRQK